jgi:hypothetical protein
MQVSACLIALPLEKRVRVLLRLESLPNSASTATTATTAPPITVDRLSVCFISFGLVRGCPPPPSGSTLVRAGQCT